MKNYLLTILSLVFFYFTSTIYAQETPNPRVQIPEGFKSIVTYAADGEYDFASNNPTIANCYHIFCPGTHWFEQVLKMTPTEIQSEETKAKAFFLKRFGLNVESLVGNNSAIFMPFAIDPRVNYRARQVDTMYVHKLGWEIHDGGFALILSQELTLDGEWVGVKVPAGTMMVYGGYAIQPSRLKENTKPRVLRNQDKLIIIRYQSGEPIFPAGPSGAFFFRCEITSSPWGKGIAQGITSVMPLRNGVEPMSVIKMATRNTLTFSGNGGLGNYVGVHNDPNLVIENP